MYPGLFTSRRQFDLVPVGIFEKGNGVATASMLHRAGLANDLNPFSSKFIAGFVNVRHAERDMPKTVANVIRVSVPIISELDDCVGLFRPVADKDIRKATRLIVSFLQELHSKSVTIEFQAFVEIIH